MEFGRPIVLAAEEILDVGNDFKWVPLSENRYMLNPTANMSSLQELQMYSLMQEAASKEVPVHSLSVNLQQAPQEVWDAVAEKAQPSQFEKYAHLAKIEEAERLFLLGAASAPTHDPLVLTKRLRTLGLSLLGSHQTRQARLHAALRKSIPASTLNTVFKLLHKGKGRSHATEAQKHEAVSNSASDLNFNFSQTLYALHHSEGYQRPLVVDPTLQSEPFSAENVGSGGGGVINRTQIAAMLDKATSSDNQQEFTGESSADAQSFVVMMETMRLARYQGQTKTDQLKQALCKCGFAPLAAEEASDASALLALELFAKRNVSVSDVNALGFNSVYDWIAAW